VRRVGAFVVSGAFVTESARLITPKRHPRAIVSVPFERAEFERIGEAARTAGVPISRYIREKALAKPTCLLHGEKTEGVEAHFYETSRTWGTA